MPLRVELVSPEEVVFEAEADIVIVRTTDGEIGFQPGHVPFVGSLVPSVVRVGEAGGNVHHIAVHSGFVEVSDDHVTVLSDVAEVAESIDLDRARASLAAAEEALRTDPEDEEAAYALRRAQVRIAAVDAR